MKKILLIITTLAATSSFSFSQSNWELGGRFGDVFSIEATIPFKAPRFHPVMYLNDNDIALGLYFDWLFALDNGPTGLKFYPGVGPEVYFYNEDVNLAIAGDFGVEYSFDFPLTVGLDWRPSVMLSNDDGFYSGNWGIFARFRFGEGVHLVPSK